VTAPEDLQHFLHHDSEIEDGVFENEDHLEVNFNYNGRPTDYEPSDEERKIYLFLQARHSCQKVFIRVVILTQYTSAETD